MGSSINFSDLKEIENTLCNSKNNIKKTNQIVVSIITLVTIYIIYYNSIITTT